MKKQKFDFSQLEKFQIKDSMQKRVFGGACTWAQTQKKDGTYDNEPEPDAGSCE